MLAQDHNRDALIGIDGFKAAMLAQEVGFRPDEAAQVFGLVQRLDKFHYRDYLLELNPALRPILAAASGRAPSTASYLNGTQPSLINDPPSTRTAHGTLPHAHSQQSLFHHQPSSLFAQEDPRLSKTNYLINLL